METTVRKETLIDQKLALNELLLQQHINGLGDANPRVRRKAAHGLTSLGKLAERAMRQDLAVPILDKFHTWLEEQRDRVLPKSPMAEAVGYALHNWRALIRYTEAGFLAIDNNVAEREMKRIAIGRKNWLFVGSAKGGADGRGAV